MANEIEREDYRPNPPKAVLPKRAPYKAHDDELKLANERGIRAPKDAEVGSSDQRRWP